MRLVSCFITFGNSSPTEKNLGNLYVLFLISTAVTALLVIKMQLMGAVLSFIVTHVILLVVYIAVVTFVLRRKNHA